jgi:hypothetical protein
MRRAAARRATAEQWSTRVAEWKASGLPGPDFATREQIDVGQLRWWKWQLGKRKARAASSIVPVRIVHRIADRPKLPGAGLEIVLRTGHAVRVPVGFDAETLRRVLGVLDELPSC